MQLDNRLTALMGGGGTLDPPAAGDAGPSVSLAQMKALNVDVQWFEAVAIVRALCVDLLESSDRLKTATLDLASVFVGPGGQVRAGAMGNRAAPSEIYAVGTILSEILPGRGRPIGLAGVLVNAMASTPFYRSFKEFSEALAYFERPDRASLVQAVYDRSRRLVSSPFTQMPEPVPLASVAPGSSAPAKTGRHRRNVRWHWAAVGVVLLAALATAAALFLPARTPAATASLPVLRSIAIAPGAALNTAVVAVGRVLGLSSVEHAEPSEPTPSEHAQEERRARPSAPRAAPAADRLPDPSPRQVPAAAPARGATVTPEPPRPPEVVAVDSHSGDRGPDITYSPRDVDVTPPTPVPPQRLGPIPLGVAGADLVTIEVLVNERGTVDAVKAVAPPRTLGESLFVTIGLSAAKSWSFQPALKDGQPVRYRTFVPITPR